MVEAARDVFDKLWRHPRTTEVAREDLLRAYMNERTYHKRTYKQDDISRCGYTTAARQLFVSSSQLPLLPLPPFPPLAMMNVMPSGELPMLWRLLEHHRYCRSLPVPAFVQHINNVNAIRQRMTETEERILYENEVFAVLSEILEARFPKHSESSAMRVACCAHVFCPYAFFLDKRRNPR